MTHIDWTQVCTHIIGDEANQAAWIEVDTQNLAALLQRELTNIDIESTMKPKEYNNEEVKASLEEIPWIITFDLSTAQEKEEDLETFFGFELVYPNKSA